MLGSSLPMYGSKAATPAIRCRLQVYPEKKKRKKNVIVQVIGSTHSSVSPNHDPEERSILDCVWDQKHPVLPLTFVVRDS